MDTKEDILMGWKIPEFTKHKRGRWWYIIATIIVLAILIYAVWTKDYLIALLTILLILVMFINEIREPGEVFFGLTHEGVVIENNLVRFQDVEKFWFIKAGKENIILYIDFKNLMRPRIAIPTDVEHVEQVFEIMSDHVEFDEQAVHLPATDRMNKWMKM